MSDGLFREEALRHHTGGQALGDVLRVPPTWVRSSFALLALAFAAAAVFAAWGSVTVYAHGIARVLDDRGTLVVFFPERDRQRILPGRPVRLLDLSDPKRAVQARVGPLRPGPVPLGEALAQLGLGGWPVSPAPSRLASGEGGVAPDPRGKAGSVTAGEVLAVEAPAGETSLLRLLVPSRRGSGHDG